MASSKGFSLLSMLGAPSLLAVAACGGSVSPAPAESTVGAVAALDSPNGGLNLASKERPAFGDPEVESLPLMDDTIARHVEPSDLTHTQLAIAGGLPYRVLLVWGHLPPSSDAEASSVEPQPAQWVGTVGVDSGAIGLRRTIAFGAADDVAMRTDPLTLSFSSHTAEFIEGVLLRVVIPSGATPTLHVKTGLVAVDIDMSKMDDRGGGIARGADSGNGLAWYGFTETGCARGFALGRWVKDSAGIGRLMSVVSDEDGVLLGYARGVWGHSPRRSVDAWFAKYIDVTGNPQGLGFGWYGFGAFDGLWAAAQEGDVDALHVGAAEGFYSDGIDSGGGEGVWLTRWSPPCVP